MLAFIPSPATGSLELGPLRLNGYGLIIGIGIVVAIQVAERRWVARGGARGEMSNMALWVVLAGLVGARAYHVLTDFRSYEGRWVDTLKVWQGGLGIWGAVAVGGLAAVILARRRNLDPIAVLDTLAPAVVLAQAIGRWGNYLNQELFGRPSTLPWAVEIDPDHRPAGFEHAATFHPTFLYESLWNLAIFVVLIRLDAAGRLRRGQVAALYVALYTFGRFWFELLRVDQASLILGVRVNAWVSAVVFAGAVTAFVIAGRRAANRHPTAT